MSKRLALYAGVLLAGYLLTILVFVGVPRKTDFSAFYGSARHYWEGVSIYAPVEIDRYLVWEAERGPPPDFLPNLNPPFFILLLLPISLLGFSTAFWVWSLLSLSCGMAAIGWIERETRTGVPKVSRQLGFLILLLAYYPTWASVQYGQVSLLLFLLLVSTWRGARKGRDRTAGFCLGVALSVKLFVGLFLLFFLVLRRYRLLLWTGLTFAACWTTSLLVFGIGTFHEFREVLSAITWSAASWNASFLGFFSRILGGSENLPLFNRPELARIAASMMSVLSAVCLVWVARSVARARHTRTFDLGFSLNLGLMLLISPLGWMYYFPFLLLPLIVMWLLSEQLPRVKLYRGLLVLSGVLSCIPLQLIPAAELNSPVDWFLWSGVYFYALVLLSLLIVTIFRQTERKLSPSPLGAEKKCEIEASAGPETCIFHQSGKIAAAGERAFVVRAGRSGLPS